MTTKIQRMNDFFDFWKTIVKQNPGFNLNNPENKDCIYSTLVFFDTEPEDNDTTLVEDGIFNSWAKHFMDNDKVNFEQATDSYYCFLNSTKKGIYHANDSFIVYAPIDHDHIEKGLTLIVDYLNNHDSAYFIKVSKKIRSDDIVISLSSTKEVKELCDYLNNTSDIKDGLIKPNPFAFIYNDIALSIGNTKSYNNILAKYIKLYIEEKQKLEDYDTISVEDFVTFLNQYYNNAFKNNNTDNIIKDFKIDKDNLNSQLLSYRNITELIIKVCDEEFDFEMFEEHYNKYKDNLFINDELLKLETKELNNQDIIDTNKLLLHALEIMIDKYDYKSAVGRLKLYVYNNCEQIITKDQNLRFDLTHSNFRINLLQLLKEKNISLNDYVKQFNDDLYDDIPLDTLIKNTTDILSNKYGYENAMKALNKYIESDNPNFITRDNNLRDNLINSNFRKRLQDYLNDNKLSLQDYIDKIIGKEHYLKRAIKVTYDKYEKAYQEGTSDKDGMSYVESALKQLLCNGSYKGFTRDNNIREELSNHINKEEAINIIGDSLDIHNNFNEEELSLEMANFLSKNYLDLILNTNEVKLEK